MNKFLSTLALISSVMVAPAAFAGERTITFAVDNMTCASCPYIVKLNGGGSRRCEGRRLIPDKNSDGNVR